jgi:hypothetical protein
MHSRKVEPMLGGALMVVALVLILLMYAWMMKDLSSMDKESFERQDEYFTPWMKAADRQLRALSTRLGADYTPGVVEWRSFATPDTLAASVEKTPGPVWGFGPVVRKVIDRYDVEVTYGLQPLIPNEQRLRAFWYAFVPRFTVTVPTPSRPLKRFDVNWSSDDEVHGVGGHMLDKAFSVIGPQFPPMPPDVARAQAVLTMNASKIWCGKDSVEVTGRPAPRAPDGPPEFCQGDFEVESMVKMIEQTLAFVRALENA